jgi:cysteinyl-tRNA synthetase
MSKSLNNFYTIKDIKKKGVDPLSLRYLFLQSHYRQTLNFTDQSLNAADEAFKKLKEHIIILRKQSQRTIISPEKLEKLNLFKRDFIEAISNDLNIPKALSILWSVIKSNIPSLDKLDLIFDFDQVFGLKLNEVFEEKIPDQVVKLAQKRLIYRKKGDFVAADQIRKKIWEKGFEVDDTPQGFKIKKRAFNNSS